MLHGGRNDRLLCFVQDLAQVDDLLLCVCGLVGEMLLHAAL
jgi:hypothetical protein